jgi:hypothetical protein
MSAEGDAQMQHIGRISVNHSFIDYALRQCILILAGGEARIVEILLGTPSFDVLITKLDEICLIRLGPATDDYARFKELVGRLRKANTNRNDAIHALTMEVEGSLVRERVGKKQHTVLSTTDLARIDKELLEVATDVGRFWGQLTERFVREGAGPRGPA